MKRYTAGILALVLTMALSASVYAGFGPPGMFGAGPGPRVMLEHMADHLDLDETQRQVVRNTFEAARPELEALRDQFRANREALEALDASNPGYEIELNAIAQSNGQLATEGTLLFTRIRSEIKAVLTEEQLEKLARGKDRMREAFERRLENQ